MAGRYDFTEEEIRRKLEELGYSHIPADKLKGIPKRSLQVRFNSPASIAVLYLNADLKHLIEAERAESRARGHLQSSTSESYFTDSYLDESKDETSSHDSSRERRALFDRYRYPLEDTAFPRPKTAPHLTKGGHQALGKENAHYYPMKGSAVRAESTSTADSSPQEQSRPGSRNIKRKVMRKRNGESRVFDESFASTDSATDISELERRIRDLPLRTEEADNADIISVGSEESTEPSDYRPWENHAYRALLPSFIRPTTRHPHTQQIKKTDPVSRYHQFKNEWQVKKAPGEKSHKNLRWNVRGKMLQCDVFEKPQRNYVPNDYVVPTEKKRQALRWQVRSNLARV